MPAYDYACLTCKREWEAIHTIPDMYNEMCCDEKAKVLISLKSNPVTYNYFSENLDAWVTGPAQRKRLMKEKHLEEVG